MQENLPGSLDEISTEELQSAIERVFLPRGEDRRILRLQRSPSIYRATFALEELDITFHDGRHLQAIFKNLLHNLWPEGDITAPEWHPALEIRIYQGVLPQLNLGTAEFYGGIAEDERCWLFVERVVGRGLDEVPDFGAWKDVIRWLAALHCVPQEELPQLQKEMGLPVHDVAQYHRLVARAFSHLRRRRGVHDELTVRFEAVVGVCRDVLDELAALEKTLIHGDFHSKNILVAPQGQGKRICVIDWEKAAGASGLIDLATLLARISTAEWRNALTVAYFEQMQSQKAGYLSKRDFDRGLENCGVYASLTQMTCHEKWLTDDAWLGEALCAIEKLARKRGGA